MDKVEFNTTTTNNENEAVKGAVKPTLSGNIEDYKIIIDLTREMKDSLKDAREKVHNSLKDRGYIVPDVLEDMVILSDDDIETGDVNKLITYIKDHLIDADMYDELFGSLSDDDIRENIKDIRERFISVHSIEKEYHNIINESKDILEEYFNYINSNRVEDSIKKRLEIMKSMKDIDDNISSSNEKKIKILEKTLDLSFITDDLNINRVANSYFKDNLSSYDVKKFESKIRKYGYNDTIYTHFLDIEETFLGEKYHPFNNLFLFIYMRYVGHSDPYKDSDGLYVRSITGAISNLIYHRFTSTENEKEFITFIENILDRFIDAGYTEQFIEKNTSYRGNESNIKAMQMLEDQKRDLVTRKLKYYGIDYSDDMSLNELMELFDSKYNELEEKVCADKEEEIDTIKERYNVDDINNAINNIKNSEDNEDEGSEDEQDETEYESTVESECTSSGNSTESEE